MLQAFSPLEDLLKRLAGSSQQSQQQTQQSPMSPNMAVGGLMPSSSDSPDQQQQMIGPELKDVEFEKFVNLINSLPQRQDYAPSKFRRISAAIAGMGSGGPATYDHGAALGFKSNVPEGLKVQQAINEQPYERALSDWELKAKPELEAAKLENSRNTNERVARYNMNTASIRDRTLSRQINADSVKERQGDEKLNQNQQRIDVSKQRANSYTYDKEHPNHTYKEDKDGNVYSINPKNNDVEFLYDDDGNFIKGSSLPDAMKMKLQHSNRMSEIDESASQSRKTEDRRETNRETLEDKKQGNRTSNILTRSGGTGSSKPESPSQRKVRLYNKAAEALNKHPEWAPYIALKTGNNFVITIPEGKTGLFGYGAKSGGNAKTAQDINDYVYGKDDKPDKSEIGSVETKSEPSKTDTNKKPEIREDGKTHVKRKSDGQSGWVTKPDMKLYDLF